MRDVKMTITTNFKKHFLLPAFVGAVFTYGALSITGNDSGQHEHISELENRIFELELLLAQKEGAPASRSFLTGAFAQQQSGETKRISVPSVKNTQPEEAANGTLTNSDGTPDSKQLLKDLGTRSDRDPRSFSEKANGLLASNSTKESIVIISNGIVDMAGNREILPDYELEMLYQNQSDPDIKRVAAQVLSTRGDNRLIEKQITEAQAGLKSDDPAERQKALVGLAKTRYASAANAIAPLLQDKDNSVKLDALLALRATGNQSHTRLVEALVNDPDPAVSWLANDVISNLQNLSERARTQLASADIIAELPIIAAP
jgi:hypothetical protein